MSARPTPTDFNYIYLLGQLESACRAARPKPAGFKGRLERSFDDTLSHAVAAARRANDVLSGLVGRVRGQAFDDRLKVEVGSLRQLESELLRNIEVFTSNRTRADRGLEHIWPSPIPVERVLERMIATTLGLLSDRRTDTEDLDARFAGCLAAAVRRVLVPALAWRALCDVALFHEDSHRQLVAAIAKRLEDGVGVQRDFGFVTVSDRVADGSSAVDRRLHIPSMVLVRAWANVLRQSCGMDPALVEQLLGKELAALIQGPSVVAARTELFPALSESFGWGVHGADRAYAIELAWKHGSRAAFDSTRLKLLSAAHSKDVRLFAEAVRHNLAEANRGGHALVADPTMDVEGLAGRAFWLAHACFRRPTAFRFSLFKGEHPDIEAIRDGEMPVLADVAPVSFKRNDEVSWKEYDKAADLATAFLLRAAEHPSASDEQRLVVRRFLAGFATNPRYWRSPGVLRQAPRWVDEYEATPGSRPSLVAQMRGRLAWQEAMRNRKRPDKDLLAEASRLYGESLAKAGRNLDDLDSEAPLHLFPEVAVLARCGARPEATAINVLSAVDFILSRNFSIYMDVEAEQEAILAGFSQAALQPAKSVPHMLSGRPN